MRVLRQVPVWEHTDPELQAFQQARIRLNEARIAVAAANAVLDKAYREYRAAEVRVERRWWPQWRRR